MAEDTLASIIALHQPRKAKTSAQRARAYRPRKRQKTKRAPSSDADFASSETLIPASFSSADPALVGSPVTSSPTAMAVARPNRIAASFLMAAAFALAGVGVTT